ncbi:hypothetical protein FS837_006842 [Tulasnella sp. UAMH 9824]|nr:hypothetical protein FS837_006842 [Tulasnella sp. UAMH 9824]
MSIIDINTLYLVERRDLLATVSSNAIIRSPLLVTATLLSFLLPITGVFTPASLGVTTSSSDTLEPCQVSAGNFDADHAPALFRNNATEGNYLGGPRSSIQRLADSTFSSQSIPPLPQYCGKNCTYQTSIDAMTFQCERNVSLPAGHLGDTEPSYGGTGLRVFWNASMAGPAADPPSPFYVGWQTGAMQAGFDGSVGTNGTALCTPMKAHYDFTVRTIDGEQSVTYNMTHTGPLESTASAFTSDAARESSFLNVSENDAFIWGDVITGIEQTAANITAALLNVELGLKDSECTLSHTTLVYRYKPENLWIPYGA